MAQITLYNSLKLFLSGIFRYVFKNKVFILILAFIILTLGFKLATLNNVSEELVFLVSDKLNQVVVKITKPVEVVFFGIKNFQKKYEFYKQEEELLKYKLLVQTLDDENNSLKKQLHFAHTIKRNFITARLLQVSKKFGDETAVISCGLNDKVQVGDVVVTTLGFFGRVKEVFQNYSKITLLTHYDSRISFISNLHKERGIVYGYENKLHLKYLEENHKLKEGEILVTSGESDFIPYGIPIGVVKKNKNNYYAEPFTFKQNIEFVHVYIRL